MIHPGTVDYVNLLKFPLYRKNNEVVCECEIEAAHTNNMRSHILEYPGRYRLLVIVSASNAKAEHVCIECVVPQAWNEDGRSPGPLGLVKSVPLG
jgi:hypothetical protein